MSRHARPVHRARRARPARRLQFAAGRPPRQRLDIDGGNDEHHGCSRHGDDRSTGDDDTSSTEQHRTHCWSAGDECHQAQHVRLPAGARAGVPSRRS
jgi:hypothetical protein